MPNIKSAIKRVSVIEKKTLQNNMVKSAYKTAVKKFEQAANEGFIEQLKLSPAMYLGSCRHKLPDVEKDPEIYKTIFARFDEMNIKAFFYIGGNDSMDTVLKLSDYAKKINYDFLIFY